jgi:hypothetical protein
MITWEDLRDSFLLTGFLLGVSFLVFLLCYVVAGSVARLLVKAKRSRNLVLLGLTGGLPIGFTGMVAGFLTGSSRASAVSALVPAILTFIGLIVVYLIGKGRLRAFLAGFIVFIFSADLLVGTVLGSASRDRHEELLSSVRVQEMKAEQESAIRDYRASLGLPLDVPKPTASVVSPPEKP